MTAVMDQPRARGQRGLRFKRHPAEPGSATRARAKK